MLLGRLTPSSSSTSPPSPPSPSCILASRDCIVVGSKASLLGGSTSTTSPSFSQLPPTRPNILKKWSVNTKTLSS